MKKTFLLLSIAPLLFATACAKTPSTISTSQVANSVYNHTLQVGNKTLSVQIVTSDEDMAQGLSGRASMNQDQGMLFDFGTNASTTPNFWMKDMKFALDFVWIKNHTVIGITKNAPAPAAGTLDENLKLYYPPSPVDEVLEVNAGWAERNNIIVGDEVQREN